MLMLNKKKKGFTLAELLIVVAIIAILTAIAVPLFVTSINKAQTVGENANIQAVRSSAIVYILTQEKPEAGKGNNIYDEEGKLYAEFEVKATVSATGEVTINYVQGDASVSVPDSCVADPENEGGYIVTCKITSVDFGSIGGKP